MEVVLVGQVTGIALGELFCPLSGAGAARYRPQCALGKGMQIILIYPVVKT